LIQFFQVKIIKGAFNGVFNGITRGKEVFNCAHRAALKFFTDSIENKCSYTAYPCRSYEEFKEGKCIECSSLGCNRMGYWASAFNSTGSLYLTTQSLKNQDSYCLKSYRISFKSGDNGEQAKARGEFLVGFKTNRSLYDYVVWDDGRVVLKSGKKVSKLFEFDNGFDEGEELVSVFVSYSRVWWSMPGLSYELDWKLEFVEIFFGDIQSALRFCSVEFFIRSGRSVEFKSC